MKPICVECQRFYRPEKNGVRVLENMPINGAGRTPPGITAPEMWRPYKLWIADLWKCHGCGHELIVGASLNPLSEQHKPDFRAIIEEQRHLIRCDVNDC